MSQSPDMHRPIGISAWQTEVNRYTENITEKAIRKPKVSIVG
jgi:hypothetical protein